ncbi:MAG: hypothetical protein RRY12_10760 [Cloacibacillus sp.]
MGDFMTSGGGFGLLGSISSGIGGYYQAKAGGVAVGAQYDAAASQALIEASALSSRYKIGAINMIMNAQAEQAEYDSAAYSYEIGGLQNKGKASQYDIEAASALLQKANSLRTAGIIGASALDVVRRGAEEESKLREQGRLFRGEQRAAAAAGGTDVNSGNVLDILRQTDEGIEADSASIRYAAQKERYSLLVQQKNYWMNAEAQQLESENYKVAAENLRSAAEVSAMGASAMRKMGDLAYQSGTEGQALYSQLSELALKSGQESANAYRQMGNSARSSAAKIAKAGLLSTVANGITGIAVKGLAGESKGGSSQQPSFNYKMDDGGWGDTAFSAGDSDWWKKNEYKLGGFVPKVKTYSGLGG